MSKTLFPYEQLAMNDEPMPEGLDLVDQMAFQTLRGIYHALKKGTIERPVAYREKMELVKTYRTNKGRIELWQRCIASHTKQVRATENAKAACRKNPTPENALRLCDAIDGIRT